MRLKKGFTLAEILIVLMVIGAIATMTIPTLIRGVEDAQFKTAYKKAYNTILNVSAMERVNGTLPTSAKTSDVANFFATLASYMSVKEFAVDTAGTLKYYSGITFSVEADTETSTEAYSKTVGGGTTTTTLTSLGASSPWIITDDNFAYQVLQPTSGTCALKADITTKSKSADAAKASCVVVEVDVNGLNKSPNTLTTQDIGSDATLSDLKDRFYIYIGKDGASAGSKDTTVTGRIIADMK